MKSYSTSEAARKMGLHPGSLARYIAAKKVPTPKMVITGRTTTHIWTEEEIETVRKLLPKIANGRKTRYKKKQSAPSGQQSAKTRRAQAGAPTLQKQKKKK